MDVVRSDTPDVEAGAALVSHLERHKRAPVLLLLSGGSSFSLLPHVSELVPGDALTIGVLDERCSADRKANNFSQLSETDFFKNALARNARSIDTVLRPGESCTALGERWERELRAWRATHKNGKIIATMGVGADGHTAGIMPNMREIDFNRSAWVVSYSVPLSVNPYPDRITTTFTFLRNIVDSAVVYVAGASKQSALQNILRNEGDIISTPARIVREMHDIRIFTDL